MRHRDRGTFRIAVVCQHVAIDEGRRRILDDITAVIVRRRRIFKLEGGQWRSCGDPGTPAYDPGEITTTRDLNGDGLLEALIMESSTFCFGVTGAGYTIVSKQADGTWKLITSGPGIPTFLPAKGVGNWPDIEVGLPGFCYPVRRWNGTAYLIDRHQYEGKPCRPKR